LIRVGYLKQQENFASIINTNDNVVISLTAGTKNAEVLQSQQIMLGKEKDVKSNAFPTGLNEAFQKQLKRVETWIESQPNVEQLVVNYSNVIENPAEEIDTIISFIGRSGNKEEMMKVVDKSLYRNRKEKK